MKKLLRSRTSRHQHGQSFVELMLIVLLLALMLAGVVEYGFMINNYLHVIGGAREAARVYNSYPAFDPITQAADPTFYYRTAEIAASSMRPITLDPTLGDDIIISVVSIRGTTINRFPTSSIGWSLCGNYAAYAATYTSTGTTPPAELSNPGWNSCSANQSKISNGDISSRVGTGAMRSGVLMVEIIYNYSQILKLPIFSNGDFFGTKFSIIPDPIPLYTYAIMPMSSAEPTP